MLISMSLSLCTNLFISSFFKWSRNEKKKKTMEETQTKLTLKTFNDKDKCHHK